MKAVVSFLLLLALGYCQNCPSTYGWSSTLPSTGTVGTGYVIGNNITVACDSQIIAINGNFASASGKFLLGVYTDRNGSPDTLIASTPANTYTANGNVRVVLNSPVNVAAGKYWLMVMYEQYSYPLYTTDNYLQPVKYMYTSFSSGLPSYFTGNYVYSYTGSTYNFWIEMSGSNACPTVFGQFTPFNAYSSHSPNYILGNQLNFTCNAYVTALGAFFSSGGGNFQLALYSDYGGNPYQLLSYTYSNAIKPGTNKVELYNPVQVSTGSYWIMGFYSQQSYPGYNTSNSNVVVKYIYRSFSLGFPDIFPSPTTYTGQLFNYWAEVQTSSCPDQVGWPDIFYDVASHSANYVLGNAVNITCASYVSAINAYFSESTGKFIMGVYSDNNGNPDELLITTGTRQTQAGQVHMALTPQFFLTEGTYWLVALYESASYPGFNDSDPNVVVKYMSRSFSSGLPDSFGTASMYHGQVFNYWLDVTPGDNE